MDDLLKLGEAGKLTPPASRSLSPTKEDFKRLDESFEDTFKLHDVMSGTGAAKSPATQPDTVELLSTIISEVRLLSEDNRQRSDENRRLEAEVNQLAKEFRYAQRETANLFTSTPLSLGPDVRVKKRLDPEIMDKEKLPTMSFHGKPEKAGHRATDTVSPEMVQDRSEITCKHPETNISSSGAGARVNTEGPPSVSSKSEKYRYAGTKMRPATFDGTSPWVDYKTHFEMCAEINQWDYTQRGLYLGASLRGQAQGLLGNLPATNRKDFKNLCGALSERFSPESQTELYRAQLREKQWNHGENIPEFGQRILRLVTLAYPKADTSLVDQLAKQSFMDAIADAEMRLKILQSRPKTLNEAINTSVELEAFDRAEKQRLSSRHARSSKQLPPMESTADSITELVKKAVQQELAAAQKKPTSNSAIRNKHTGIRCYRCKEKGHIQRNCPLNKNQSTERTERPVMEDTKRAGRSSRKTSLWWNKKRKTTHRTGSNFETKAVEAGMYAEASIQGQDTHLLIDSGATASMLSKTVFQQIKDTNKPRLKAFENKMVAVNGEPLAVQGIGNFDIHIKGRLYKVPMIVAELNAEGILGLDFLREHDCELNMKHQTLKINGQKVTCSVKGKIGCCRVSLSETVTIPPRHEVVLNGQVADMCNTASCFGVIEPSLKFIEAGKAFLGRSLVRAKENVPIRLLNTANQPVVIQKNTIVGEFEPVEDTISCREIPHERQADLPKHVKDLLQTSMSNLSETQKTQVEHLLKEYIDVFAASDEDLGRTDIVQHRIDTNDAKPIRQRLRRLPHCSVEEVDKQVDDMLKRGVIETSVSPWASGVVLVKKKDGTLRFCIDYRALNSVTEKDAYPLPNIDEMLGNLSGASWFSTLDLCSGFWQVGMDPKDKAKTAFITRKGLFLFKVLPFGLCNAPATFERLMETVLSGLQWDICLIYIDDVIVYGKSFDNALENLRKVFDRLRSASLKLKARKCKLFSKSVSFLGHIVSDKGIQTDPDKIKAVQEWPVPSNQTEVRSFLGLCGYYRRFISHFASVAKPLHRLTEKGRAFLWTEECEDSFQELKRHLTSAPILAFPDFSKPFILDTDSSEKSIGAVLSQVHDGKEVVVCYGSRVLTKSEKRYCVTRKELLALIYFVKYYRHYLIGKKFTIRTDHSALRWLMNTKNPEGQLARWIDTLSTYQFDIIHRPGKKHANADALSRRPCKQCGRSEGPMQDVNVSAVSSKTIHTDNNIVQAQQADKDISLVKTWLKSGQKPSWKEVSKFSPVVKALWSQLDRLEIKDNLLCRTWYEKGKPSRQQIVVPKEVKETIIEQYHDTHTGGHFGVRKTLSKIRRQYYWVGLQRDVNHWIKSCEKCCKRKGPLKTKKSPMQIVGAGHVMQRIAADIMGPLPETRFGNKYILVISDYFSKWVEAFAIPDQTAITVAECLVEEIVCRYGVPTFIHSDQGRQFEGSVFQEMCRLLNIKKTRTTPYHPQSDGMVERYNKTLARLLSAFVNVEHTDWDEVLPYVMMAYRSSEHETTGFTPNMMFLGREVSVPLDVQFGNPVDEYFSSEWVSSLRKRLEEAHEFARTHIDQEMRRQKRYYDMKLSWEHFKEGDHVLVYFPTRKPGTSPKLTSYWRGPYTIVRKLSDVTFRVSNDLTKKEQVIHLDRMKSVLARQQIDRQDPDIDSANEADQSPDGLMDTDTETPSLGRGKRARRLPAKLTDYIL